MSTELLPCPFCGSAEDKLGYNASWNEIQCQKCGATNPTVSRHAPQKMAVTAWNTRTLIEPETGLVQDTTDWKVEAERYRKGMEHWKATAEEKDRNFAKALADGITKRVAQDAQPTPKLSIFEGFPATETQIKRLAMAGDPFYHDAIDHNNPAWWNCIVHGYRLAEQQLVALVASQDAPKDES